MEPLTRNGGFIGVTLDFASTEQYIVGSSSGSVSHFATTTGNSVDITYPTGIQADDIIIIANASDNNDPNSYNDVNGVQFERIYNDQEGGNGSVHALRVTGSTGAYAEPNDGDPMNWVCSVFRGVDPTQTLSNMLANDATGENGLPNPPATGGSVPTDAMIVITGGLDDDDNLNWTPAAPSGFTLAGWNGAQGQNATAMLAYAQGTGVSVNPDAFTAAAGSASDAWDATTLVLDGGGSVVEYGNYKNSGIWDLQAVYESLFVPSSGGTEENAVFVAPTSSTVSLSGLNFVSGDNLFVFAYDENGTAGLALNTAGWTELQYSYRSGTGTGMVYHKISDGTETSVSVTANNYALCCVILYAVSGSYTYEASTQGIGVVAFTNPNPAQISNFVTGDISLVFGAYGDDIAVITPSAGYTKLAGGTNGSTNAGSSAALGTRDDVSGAVDPGAFSGASDENYAVHVRLSKP